MDENLNISANTNKWQEKKLEREAGERKKQKLKLARKLLWQGVFLFLAGIAVFGIVKYGPAVFTRQTATLSLAVTSDDWTKGPSDAPHSIVEYSDFECPACSAYSVVVDQLLKDFPEKINITYRHFPLPMHRNARLAAQSAQAAGLQGKFWEMHDLLFSRQSQWTDTSNAKETFEKYAVELGLNLERYNKDLDSKEVISHIELHEKSGLDALVNHTPTFFIDGKEIPNPRNYDEFKSTISNLP